LFGDTFVGPLPTEAGITTHRRGITGTPEP